MRKFNFNVIFTSFLIFLFSSSLLLISLTYKKAYTKNNNNQDDNTSIYTYFPKPFYDWYHYYLELTCSRHLLTNWLDLPWNSTTFDIKLKSSDETCYCIYVIFVLKKNYNWYNTRYIYTKRMSLYCSENKTKKK